MIIAGFYMIGALLLSTVSLIFSALSFVVPVNVTNSIAYGASQLAYFNGILPLSGLMYALLSLLVFYISLYGVKLLVWVLKKVPFLGIH